MPFEMPPKIHIPPSGIKAPAPPIRTYNPFSACSIREQLKRQIDEMSEEEVKLLSYRLRLDSLTKEMDILEDDIEKLKNKRKGCQNDN